MKSLWRTGGREKSCYRLVNTPSSPARGDSAARSREKHKMMGFPGCIRGYGSVDERWGAVGARPLAWINGNGGLVPRYLPFAVPVAIGSIGWILLKNSEVADLTDITTFAVWSCSGISFGARSITSRTDPTCRRPIKMSPVCQAETTHPGRLPGGVWDDGSADERWGDAAARGAAGFGSAATDDRGGGTAARARAASSVSAVEGLSDRRSDRPDLETPRPPQQPAQARGAAACGGDNHPPVVLGFWPDVGGREATRGSWDRPWPGNP